MRKNWKRPGTLAAVVLLVATGCWRQDGGDAAHSGFAPNEATVTTANVAALTRAWTTSVGAPRTSPVIDVGSVFVAGGGGVTAYDLTNGAPRWNISPPDPVLGTMRFERNLTITDDGLVAPYRTSATGGFKTLSKANGAVLASTGDYQTRPGSSKVFRSDASAEVNAQVVDGMALFMHYGTRDAFIDCCTNENDVTNYPTEPSIIGRHVVLGLRSRVSSYSLDSCPPTPVAPYCAPEWSVDLPAKVSTPVGIDETKIAVADANGDITVLDAATGARLWTGRTAATKLSTPAVGPRYLYAGGADGKVYAFDKGGRGCAPGGPTTTVPGPPVPLPATCAPAWSVDTGAGVAITDQPLVAANVVYAGTAKGTIVALATECVVPTCPKLWTGTVDDGATRGTVTGIAIDAGSLYATTSTGNLAAFRLP